MKALIEKILKMWILEALTMLLVISYILVLSFPRSAWDDTSKFIIVNPLRDHICELTFWIALITFSLTIAALIHRKRFAVCSLIVTGSSPLVFIGALIADLGAHEDVESIRCQDGAEYHMLASHFLQGSHLAIGRLEGQDLFHNRMRVVAWSPWEEAFGYLGIVRPKTLLGGHKLLLTHSQMLVGVVGENMAFLAYDVKSGRWYGQPGDNTEQAVWTLSPFLLLGPEDVPNEEDFKALLDPNNFGRPDATAVLADFNNPNPRVREMAKKLHTSLLSYPPRRN